MDDSKPTYSYSVDFFDTFSVTVEGSGSCTRSLQRYYEKLIKSNSDAQSDLFISEWEDPPKMDTKLGGAQNFYARSNRDRFVIKRGTNFVTVDTDWTRIETSPETSHFFVSTLIEFALRRRMVEDGYALVHASGINVNGTTVVFPAWLHTGKTNTMLSLLKDGGGYLSDDRVWVHKSGDVRGYPLPVNMLPYNYESFPDLLDIPPSKRVRYWLSEWVQDLARRDRSIVDKAVLFFNQFYIEPDLGEVLHIDELIPQSEFVTSEQIDNLVLLRTKTSPESEVFLEPLSTQEALREIQTTSYYEWNRRIEEYCRVIDTLFPDQKMTEAYRKFADTERDVFSSLLEQVDIHRLRLPREKYWNEAGVSRQLRSEIGKLF